MSINDTVNSIFQQCVKRKKLNPLQAAYDIDQAVEGMSGVEFHPFTQLSIGYDHGQPIGISSRGLNRKELGRAEELAMMLHYVIRSEGRAYSKTCPTYVQLRPRDGRKISTKHYKEEFQKIQARVHGKYEQMTSSRPYQPMEKAA